MYSLSLSPHHSITAVPVREQHGACRKQGWAPHKPIRIKIEDAAAIQYQRPRCWCRTHCVICADFLALSLSVSFDCHLPDFIPPSDLDRLVLDQQVALETSKKHIQSYFYGTSPTIPPVFLSYMYFLLYFITSL